MPFAISPDHTSDDFDGELSLDEKIEVFISRVKGWQLERALDLKEAQIQHRGFAQLLIVTSYFEMIGKYQAGYVGEGAAGKYFRKGLHYTFPDLLEDDKDRLSAFYRSIRNGLYHVGITAPNVIIYDGISNSFEFDDDSGFITISPDRFVQDLIARFDQFAAELRDPSNTELRQNFEKRFDSDNSLEAT